MFGFCGFGHGEVVLPSLKQNTLTELGCCAFACAEQIASAADRARGFKSFKVNLQVEQVILCMNSECIAVGRC